MLCEFQTYLNVASNSQLRTKRGREETCKSFFAVVSLWCRFVNLSQDNLPDSSPIRFALSIERLFQIAICRLVIKRLGDEVAHHTNEWIVNLSFFLRSFRWGSIFDVKIVCVNHVFFLAVHTAQTNTVFAGRIIAAHEGEADFHWLWCGFFCATP